MFRTGIAALALVLVAGCGSSMQSVEVNGKKADINQLAGSWQGELAGASNEQANVAIAVSVNRRDAYKAMIRATIDDASNPKPLKVVAFRVDSQEIAGTLAPYIDPVCMCTARTTFTGKILGDVVHGTFVTHMPTLEKKRTGTWSMLRN